MANIQNYMSDNISLIKKLFPVILVYLVYFSIC